MSEGDANGGNRRADIENALTAVRDRLTAACVAADRDPGEVTLLPVTKFFPASDIEILRELGCSEFGESREQDATSKVVELGSDGIRWHMIGHLQRNKAKNVAAWAYSIHSVDSARLITALDKAVRGALDDGDRAAPLDVLLQVSLDGDVHRGGAPREELAELADRVAESTALRFAGVMAVPPIESDADAAFADLAAIHENLLRVHPEALQRSAGMTGDLEEAVRHGSTCVRVGTAILGPRPITSP
ncbi:YggS family pyridoxal phosphate enzyme [Rhodococcoides trifolii]|uniref:Pyridoxal phosphate homeostasis protein n=1 Tax=Rhodococcoides trifolii TaxID=908250 RepID=A0A917D101_9NOCA|nr:YggS family pyridoxal phosphate-dependent enzyme [Rhodococcus trifolii]GGG05535.1 YggS family pyridoxal phosphate enzyme [Rhodococcus trifolii]